MTIIRNVAKREDVRNVLRQRKQLRPHRSQSSEEAQRPSEELLATNDTFDPGDRLLRSPFFLRSFRPNDFMPGVSI